MAQVFLDSPDVDPLFQEVGGIRMPEGVGGDVPFGNFGHCSCATERSLNTGPSHVGLRVCRPVSISADCGKQPNGIAVG